MLKQTQNAGVSSSPVLGSRAIHIEVLEIIEANTSSYIIMFSGALSKTLFSLFSLFIPLIF